MNGRGRDQGKVAVFFAMMMPVWMTFLGLVVIGGGHVQTYQRAYYVAAEAARAGGQAINYGPAIDGTAHKLDAPRARTAAQNYLAAVGATGTVFVDIIAQTVRVTATVTYRRPIGLPVLGAVTFTATGTATAHPVII